MRNVPQSTDESVYPRYYLYMKHPELVVPVDLRAAVGAATVQSLNHIRAAYEINADPDGNLSYHNTIHTRSIIGRTVAILTLIHRAAPGVVSERDILLGAHAAALHDYFNESEIISSGILTVRKRAGGANEMNSTDAALGLMKSPDFFESDRRIMREAIPGTIVAFDPNKGLIQPNVSADSSLVTVALALADVGSAGMEGPDALTADSYRLFVEDNVTLSRFLNGYASLTLEQKDELKRKFVSFMAFQKTFVLGRMEEFHERLSYIPDSARIPIHQLFFHFEDSLHHAELLGEQAKSMSFEDLVARCVEWA